MNDEDFFTHIDVLEKRFAKALNAIRELRDVYDRPSPHGENTEDVRIIRLLSTIKNLEVVRDKWITKATTLEKKIIFLRSKNTAPVSEEAQSLQKKIDDRNTVIDRLTSQIETYKERVGATEIELSKTKDEVKKLHSVSAENMELKERVTDYEDKVRNLRSSLNVCVQKFRDYKKCVIKEKPKFVEFTETDEILEEIKKSQSKTYEFGK